ncbi:MAG: alpha/beta hydrolase [bacterium]
MVLKFSPRTFKQLFGRISMIVLLGMLLVGWWYARTNGYQLLNGREHTRIDWCEINTLFCKDNMQQRLSDVPFKELEVNTVDGIKLHGYGVESVTGLGVILLHPYRGISQQMMPIAASLYDKGVGSIMLDFRGHGTSQGNVISFGRDEMADIQAAYQQLTEQLHVVQDRVAIIGWGYGASMGLLYAAQHPEIKVIVADSPYANLDSITLAMMTDTSPFIAKISGMAIEHKLEVDLDKFAPQNYIEQLSKKMVLLFVPTDDELFPSESMRVIFPDEMKGLTVQTGEHYKHLQFYTQNPAKYTSEVVKFVIEKLENIDDES